MNAISMNCDALSSFCHCAHAHTYTRPSQQQSNMRLSSSRMSKRFNNETQVTIRVMVPESINVGQTIHQSIVDAPGLIITHGSHVGWHELTAN